MEYNYVEVNKNYFPTKCLNYPADAKIETRMLTVGDAKLLAMLDESNTQQVIMELLKRCCRFTNMSLQDLYVADKDYLLFFIRSGSFVMQNGYTFTIEHCENCKQACTFNVKLSDLQLDCTETFTKTLQLTNGQIITAKLPRISDPVYKVKDLELTRLLNYTNVVEIYGSVENAITELLQLDAMQYVMINNILDSMKCGIREELLVTCPHCNHELLLKWSFSDEDMLSKIDIRQLLQDILNIAKYTHYQINDDLLYSEFEFIKQIVAKMIEDENSAIEKAQGKQTFFAR